MKAKSVLLTVPLAMSALTFLTLPANAVCWSWKPCADLQGYGYGGTTESQAVLPPLPADGSVPPGSTAAPGRAPGATAAPGPAGSPEQLKPAKKPAATATAAPQAASAAKPKPKPAPAPAQTAAPRTGCSGKSGTASGASTGPGPGSGTCGTSAGACAYASPGEGGAASAASTSPGSGPGSPATATGSCPQTGTRSGGSAGIGAGHDADGARHGDHAGDPRIGESGRGGEKRRKAVSGFDAMRCCVDG